MHTDTDATGGWTAVGSAGPTNYKEAAKTAVANLATKDSRAITASFTGGNKDIRPQESTFEACALCHVQVLALGGLFAATFAWWAAAAGAVAPATLGTLEGYLAQLFPDTPAAAIAKKITEWKGYYSAGMSIKDIVWEVCTWEGMCTGA